MSSHILSLFKFNHKKRGFEIVKPIHRKNPDCVIKLPTRGSATSAGYDFYLPRDIYIHAGEQTTVWTDVKAYLKPAEVLLAFPRSSLGTKQGIILANIVGVVDSDYYSNESNDGNIGLVLKNTSNFNVELKAGERVSQGIFIPFLVADNGNTKNKRMGGYGSTGKA